MSGLILCVNQLILERCESVFVVAGMLVVIPHREVGHDYAAHGAADDWAVITDHLVHKLGLAAVKLLLEEYITLAE